MNLSLYMDEQLKSIKEETFIPDDQKKEIIKNINKSLPVKGKLVFLTISGSHLFGLNTPNSDIDIKGLYMNDEIDLSKDKLTYIDLSTNKSKFKNSNKDIDINLFSIHKFFKMIKDGDTNAYDLLFSLFRDDTILFNSKESDILKSHYLDLLSTNASGFLGYVVSQTKKYGVKGERYNALLNIIDVLNKFIVNNNLNLDDKIVSFLDQIKDFENKYVLEHIKPESESIGGGRYLEILNKQYRESVTFEYLLVRLNKRLQSYGERAQKAAEGIDFKSLSHAYRIIVQFEELLETQFIKFPLQKKESILKIKNGDLSEFNDDYEFLLNVLDKKVDYIQNNLNGMTSYVKDEVFNTLLIHLISLPYNK